MKPVPYVLDTSGSPAARLVPAPLNAVTLSPDGFWGRHRHAICRTSIPKLFELFEEKGCLDNFRRLTGRKDCPRRGPLYTDSDLFKWMEAAAFALADQDHPVIRTQLETAIREVLPAQHADGYLNTYFTDPAQRFTIADAHEMYCAGHYFQAAVAIYRSLGDDRVLRSAMRYADYLYDQFGPGKPRTWACGHPEIEMALVELYRAAGQKKYLDLAGHILSQLNAFASRDLPEARDTTVKFADRRELFGHAVRNLYMACAGSDLWAETGDKAVGKAVRRLWENLVTRRIYITGAVGSRYGHEAIGLDYELPNLMAYGETCAAIANVFWNYRNLQVTAEAPFADWMERSLYNGVLAGLSLDYTRYFYVNPLASLGDHGRQEWFTTTCCPTNMVRLLASIPGYFYSTGRQSIWVHLYDSGTADLHLSNGQQVRLTQQTLYPFEGKIQITLEMDAGAKFALNLRIPGWADTYTVKINGKTAKTSTPTGRYLALNRTWQNHDVVELVLPMPVKAFRAHPQALDNYHRVALMRGPLVYCLEGVDHPGLDSIHRAAVNPDLTAVVASAKLSPAQGFRQFIPAIKIPGRSIPVTDGLYQPMKKYQVRTRATPLTAIPYYAWANRGTSQMTVWIPVTG